MILNFNSVPLNLARIKLTSDLLSSEEQEYKPIKRKLKMRSNLFFIKNEVFNNTKIMFYYQLFNTTNLNIFNCDRC